jgi:hypothetical protein
MDYYIATKPQSTVDRARYYRSNGCFSPAWMEAKAYKSPKTAASLKAVAKSWGWSEDRLEVVAK